MELRKTEGYVPNELIDEASGAVVDRHTRYIGLIISTEERPFRTHDLSSYDEAVERLAKAGIPMQEDRSLRRAFWLTAAAGAFVTLILLLAN